MAVTQIDRYNCKTRIVSRDPVILVFDVDGGTVSGEMELMPIPQGTVVSRAAIQCIRADVGPSYSKLNVMIGASSVLNGSADNGGTLNVVEDGSGTGADTFYANQNGSTGGFLRALVLFGTGTITTSPQWRIVIEIFRPDW